jgi:hypothetical protein
LGGRLLRFLANAPDAHLAANGKARACRPEAVKLTDYFFLIAGYCRPVL